jgi:hypothetical protein
MQHKKETLMKFKEYLALITDEDGFIPLPHFKWVIQKNPRKTAREEAIAAEVIRQANPRENITGHFPWGPEEQLVLQQLWIKPETEQTQWRDVPILDADELYTVKKTKHGDLPVPNAVNKPGMVRGNFKKRLREIFGEETA